MSPDKYYVYALFKPNGVPFYIGKGIRSRINNHFKPSNLKVNNRKTAIIKKYGDLIKREILAYFDIEQEAYTFEEYLISHYGLITEGGLLTNYAKTRFQYSDAFSKEVCSQGSSNRKLKYSEEVIVKFYKMYFTDNSTVVEIRDALNIPVNYIPYLAKGKKQFKFYAKYIQSGLIKNERNSEVILAKTISNRSRKISDDLLIDSYVRYKSGNSTITNEATALNCNMNWLGKVFSGDKRKYLNLPEVVGMRKTIRKPIESIEYVLSLKLSGKQLSEIVELSGIPRTTCYRILKQYNENK